MKDYRLSPLWDLTIEIYSSFKRICEKHGLRFWAMAGTALGAVRHKGFIPWDDDFDVMMPWSDYLRFHSLASTELPEHLRLVHFGNTPEFDYLYSKIQDTRKNKSEEVSLLTGHPQSEGLFIDIFPFGGVSDAWLDRPIKSAVYRMIRTSRVEHSSCSSKAKIARLLGKTLKGVRVDLRNKSDFMQFCKSQASMCDFDKSTNVAHFDEHLFAYHFVYQRKWFDETILVPFYNDEVPLPREYDKMLTSHFGDYMTLPPEDKRVFTHGNRPAQPWKFGPTTVKE